VRFVTFVTCLTTFIAFTSAASAEHHSEQQLSVRTVDITPTLAALIGLEIPAEEMDGRCLDIDGGERNSCD